MRLWFPLILLAAPLPLQAATVTAASCSEKDVNAALRRASRGDTVLVPDGSCTWTSGVTVSKDLTISGSGATHIIGDLGPSGGSGGILDLGTTKGRLTNITFELKTSRGTVIVRAQGQNVRVDHVTFRNGSRLPNPSLYFSGGTGVPHPTALVDDCTFHNARVHIQADLRLHAAEIWHAPSTIGNADQKGVVYVEDCKFYRTVVTRNCIDGEYGARYVFRHNYVENSAPELHSVAGNWRGGRSLEVYANRFVGTASPDLAAFIRSGTGVFFDNTYTGSYGRDSLALDNVRSYRSVPIAGPCDGKSSWDGNEPGQSGWPCRDQIGRGADASTWWARSPKQASEPMYFWNNTLNGAVFDPTVINNGGPCKPGGSSADIVLGRDYYTGTPRPGYVSYPYPHPRNTGGDPAGGTARADLGSGWMPAAQREALPERLAALLANLGR
jgi:hypothetical protein